MEQTEERRKARKKEKRRRDLRILRIPNPIKPPPPFLKAVHLCFRKHLQEDLVIITPLIRRRVRSDTIAPAVFIRTPRREDIAPWAPARNQRARPPVAPADVRQVFCAVGISLRPLGHQRRTVPSVPIHR